MIVWACDAITNFVSLISYPQIVHCISAALDYLRLDTLPELRCLYHIILFARIPLSFIPHQWTIFLPRVQPDLLSWESPYFGIASLEVAIAMNFLCDRSSNQKVPPRLSFRFSMRARDDLWKENRGYLNRLYYQIDLVQIKVSRAIKSIYFSQVPAF